MTKAGENLFEICRTIRKSAENTAGLLKLFENAPEQKLNLARKELARAALLGVTIDRLEKDITMKGYEEDYQNGQNQKGKKKTAAADLHVSLYQELSRRNETASWFLGAGGR